MLRARFAIGMVAVLVALASAAWSMPSSGGGSDKALLKAGVLRAKDVPTRWKSASVRGDSTNALKGVSGCEEQSAALDLPQRRAFSRAFYDPTTRGKAGFTTQASNVVRVFKDTADADRFVSAYKATGAGACLQQVNENDLKRRNPSFDVRVTSVAPLTGLADAGDGNVGYELVVTLTGEQQPVTGYMDLIWVRVGRVVLGLKVVSQQNQPVFQLTDIVIDPVRRVDKAEK
jgi:hypothetical protein